MYHERWYGLAVAVLATWRVTHLLAKEERTVGRNCRVAAACC